MTTISGMVTDEEAGKIEWVIKSIKGSFDKFEHMNSRSTDYLHDLLDQIYVAGHRIDANQDEKYSVLMEVRKRKDVYRRSKLRVDEKTGIQLILTLLLGNRDRRALKSKYHAALVEAKALGVEPSPGELTTWLKKMGGIEGVLALRRKRMKRERKAPANLAYVLEHLPKPNPSAPLIEFQVPTEEEFPEGFGVLIVVEEPPAEGEEPSGKRLLRPVSLVTDAIILKKVASFAAAQQTLDIDEFKRVRAKVERWTRGGVRRRITAAEPIESRVGESASEAAPVHQGKTQLSDEDSEYSVGPKEEEPTVA